MFTVEATPFMKKIVFFLTLCFHCLSLRAQDTQYSQFYANALYLSPAFAGAQQNTRGIVATRYQWPSQAASYISYTASFDHYFERYKSGVGLIVNSDVATPAHLRTTEIGGQYAYQINLSKKVVFRPAVQLSYVSKKIDYSKLTFGSQYTDDGFIGGKSGESLLQNSVSYVDISSGGLLYSERYWVGFSANHMNQPNQSFMAGTSRLPAKFSFFGGYTWSFTPAWRKRHVNPNEEKSISPTFLYKMQGKSDQLDIGLYGRYNALVVGMWYRGVPLKVYKPEKVNNDALIFLVGIVYKEFTFGYSYDLTISRLTAASGGSHEITASYSIKHKKKKTIMKMLPCPKF